MKTILLAMLMVGCGEATTIYTFNGTTFDGINQSFQITVPTPVVNETTFLPKDTDYCGGCLAVIFYPNNCIGTSLCFDTIQVDSIRNTGYLYFFPSGTFKNPGMYQSEFPFNRGVVVVNDPPNEAPEPNMGYVILGMGLVTIGWRKIKK